ncbi:hypothetical protein NLJ89_g8352 [Agrocybe chaxingu]|uniref:DUF6535 domain-containing protein n=1 Tax=Agrocybe chaxingu TaxID=84603 RepID=A0A9W8JV23_9AGAR|nr:hypothetical protein NLJ89_g8352 [Agrocybe chaxingu]
MFRANKGAIDNLLIFVRISSSKHLKHSSSWSCDKAGLFSATVTSFTVESYKWLEHESDHPTRAEVRINMFWFSSLTLSMATVLIGIVCMQWLREFRRDATRSHKDALAMRQMRYEGLVAWKVPVILSLLPLLLLLAFVLFFAGILELLWAKHRAVAAVVTVNVGVVCWFLIMTTVLPALQSLSTSNKDLNNVNQCPYKSPQSWAFYRLCILIAHRYRLAVHALGQMALAIIKFMRKGVPSELMGLVERGIRHNDESYARSEPPQFEKYSDKTWIEHDVRWRALRDAQYADDATEQPFNAPQDGADLVKSLQWVNRTFSEDISAVHLIFHCLTDLNCSIATQLVGGLDESAAYLPGLLFPPGSEDPTIPRSPRVDISPSHPMHLRPDRQTQEHIFAAFLAIHKENHPSLNDSYLECAIRLMNEAGQYIPHLPVRPSDSGDVFQVISPETVLQLFSCLKKLLARQVILTENASEIFSLLRDLYRQDPDMRDPLLTLTFDFFECFQAWVFSAVIPHIERTERVKVCTMGIILLFGSMSVDQVFALRKTESFVKLEHFALDLEHFYNTRLQPRESPVLDGLRVRRWRDVMSKIFSTSVSGPPTADAMNVHDHAVN